MKPAQSLLPWITLLVLLCLGLGCAGTMTVAAVNPDDDDSSAGDDDDLTPGSDDDDLTPGDDDDDSVPGDDDDSVPGDDDDSVPGDDDDDDDPEPEPIPIADCGPFVVPPGSENAPQSAHYSGQVLAERTSAGTRLWTGCEVRRYFDQDRRYQCQIYWSMNGERVEWDNPCSVYVVEATYVAEYSDCVASEIGDDAYLIDNFTWSYGTEYHWNMDPWRLSLWSATGALEDHPGGPPGGACGFNGPNGNEWYSWDSNIAFQNWGGDDQWENLEFEYSTGF